MFYSLILIALSLTTNTAISMEHNNSLQKIENHLSQEIKKTNFSHSTIKEICFIQKITDNLLIIHNLRIPQ